MADSNKAPNDFFDNWNKIQSMSYKNVIELLVKRSSEKKILALIQFEIDQFPENVQKDLVISESSLFYNGILGLFKEEESGWWSSTTVTDACIFFFIMCKKFYSLFSKLLQNR